jgi:Class II flagellar assembly regulator
MRVYGLNGTGAAVVSTPVRRPASDSFSVGNETAPRAAAGAGAPRLIGGIDALLALQGFDDPLERRRRAVKRGRTALDALDSLKLGLLSGTLETGALAALKSVAAELADRTGEPDLDTLLAEIELRVGVELAKIGMPPKDASAG